MFELASLAEKVENTLTKNIETNTTFPDSFRPSTGNMEFPKLKNTEITDKSNPFSDSKRPADNIATQPNIKNQDIDVNSTKHITTINEGLKGEKHPGTNVEYQKHTFTLNGERVEGVFPKFDSKFNTVLPKDIRNASDVEQFKYCTEQLSKRIESNPEFSKQFTDRQIEQIKNGEPRISGLTWHHNEIPGKMQLVNSNEHAICRHTGGRSIWGGGSNCR